MSSGRKINPNSPVYKDLLSKTYEDLIEEEELGTDEVKFILSTINFWRAKYRKDYEEPEETPASWRKAYIEEHLKDTPKYRSLLVSSYRDLNDQMKLENNSIAIAILSSNEFWRKKYIRDYNKPTGRVENWKKEYKNKFYEVIIDEAVDNILVASMNDITAIRSIVYNEYNRSLSREIRKMGHDMGGCRLTRSQSNVMKPESELENAWLLDNTKENATYLQNKMLKKIFVHYNKLTSRVERSGDEYYGAMFIGLTFNSIDYIYGTPHITNDNKVYKRKNEPEAIKVHLSSLMADKVKYISIYIFMSPEGADVSNWIIKHEKDEEVEESGFENINLSDVRLYLRNVISSDTIFPIITHTLPNMRHTSKCGPWVT